MESYSYSTPIHSNVHLIQHATIMQGRSVLLLLDVNAPAFLRQLREDYQMIW